MASVVKVERSEEHEISRLRELLARKTAECEAAEDKLSRKTAEYEASEDKLACKIRHIKQQDAFTSKLEEQQLQHLRERQFLLREKNSLTVENTLLREQVETSQHLKQALEKAQQILETLLSEERVAKRARLHQ